MPSKLLVPLVSFGDGLNTAVNNRDIKDTEYIRGDNLDSSIQGRLRCIGKLDTFFDTATSGDTNLGGVDTVAGYGLYAFNVDRDTLNAEVDGSYIAVFESSTYGPIISVDDFVDSGTNIEGTYTNVPLTGGNGTGAIGKVTVNNSGDISAVEITASGSGYAINDELGIVSDRIENQVLTVLLINDLDDNIGNIYTNVPLAEGDGTGAKATVVVSANGGSDEIQSVTITDGGSGYAVNNDLIIKAGYIGTGGGGGTVRVASITSTGSSGGTVDVAVISTGIQLYVEPTISSKNTLDNVIALDSIALGSGNGYARSSTKVDYLAVDGSLRVFNRNHHFSPQKWWYLETGGIYFNATIKNMANNAEDATILEYTAESIKGYKQDNQFVKKPTGGTVYKSVVGDNGIPKLTSSNVISEGEVGLIINRHNQTGVGFVGWGESVGEEDRYDFHASFVYDGNQESMTKRIGAATLGGKTSGDEHNDISFTAVVRPCDINNSILGTVSWNPRITSVRIYYRKVDESKDILYFIGDYPTKTNDDTEEIARIDVLTNFGLAYLKGDGTGKGLYAYNDWGIYHKQPPVIFTHAVKSGIRSNSVSVECKYKTATILNRKLYVGNIKQRTEDSPNIEKQYPDRLLKSINNRFDVLPDTEFVDVAVRDGESIVKLAAFGNRLLQFKENTLYVIAVAGGEEYLEATFKNMGVRHPNAVTVFEQGVFWVNEFGAYLFNGEGAPVNIINNKIAIPDWYSFITDNSVTGYYAREQKLFVIDSANLWNPSSTKIEMYIFNMLTQSWNVQKSVVGETGYNAVSNIINYKDVISHGGQPVGTNHTLFMVGKDVSGAKFLEYKSIDDLSAPYPLLPVTFITKELTANTPHQRKKIYGCYITYRGNMTQDNNNISDFTNTTCQYVNSDFNVTMDSTSLLIIGQTISDSGSAVPADTTVASITNATTFKMSKAATDTPSSPVTTTFANVDYIVPKVKMHFVSQGKTTDTITLIESESGLSFDDASGWETAKYLVSSADKVKARNIYSVKLEVSPGTNSTAIDSSFEINDISLIMRMKSVK